LQAAEQAGAELRISLLLQPQTAAVLALIETGAQEKLVYVPRGWAAWSQAVRTSAGELDAAATLGPLKDYVHDFIRRSASQ
jgi:hypothetical protein